MWSTSKRILYKNSKSEIKEGECGVSIIASEVLTDRITVGRQTAVEVDVK
jgi:hypothetical protein